MSLIKSFTYIGPDQDVRVGSETFLRHVLTTVSDEATIKELRTRDDFTEANPAPVVEAKAKPAPTPAVTPKAPPTVAVTVEPGAAGSGAPDVA